MDSQIITIAITIVDFLRNKLPQFEVVKIHFTYGIAPSLSDAEALDCVLDIVSTAVFYTGALAYAKPSKDYLLHFDQKKTFPSPLNGKRLISWMISIYFRTSMNFWMRRC